MDDLDFGADMREFWRSAIKHLAAIADGAVDQVDQAPAIGEVFRLRCQHGDVFGVVEQNPAGSTGENQRVAYR